MIAGYPSPSPEAMQRMVEVARIEMERDALYYEYAFGFTHNPSDPTEGLMLCAARHEAYLAVGNCGQTVVPGHLPPGANTRGMPPILAPNYFYTEESGHVFALPFVECSDKEYVRRSLAGEDSVYGCYPVKTVYRELDAFMRSEGPSPSLYTNFLRYLARKYVVHKDDGSTTLRVIVEDKEFDIVKETKVRIEGRRKAVKAICSGCGQTIPDGRGQEQGRFILCPDCAEHNEHAPMDFCSICCKRGTKASINAVFERGVVLMRLCDKHIKEYQEAQAKGKEDEWIVKAIEISQYATTFDNDDVTIVQDGNMIYTTKNKGE